VLEWDEDRAVLEEQYVKTQFRQKLYQTILQNRSIIKPETDPNNYPYNPYADFQKYNEASNFIKSLPWPRARIDAELTYLKTREQEFEEEEEEEED
jgi:hypothetical protein